MTYLTRYTEAQASLLVKELQEEGFNAYYIKSNANAWGVRYWK